MERMELIKHYCAAQGLGSRDLIIILHHSDKRVHKLKGNYLSFIKMLREVAHYNNYDMKRLSPSTVHVSVINLQLTPMFEFYRIVWCRGIEVLVVDILHCIWLPPQSFVHLSLIDAGTLWSALLCSAQPRYRNWEFYLQQSSSSSILHWSFALLLTDSELYTHDTQSTV